MPDLDNIFDFLFGIVAFAALAKFLPPIAAILSIIWTGSRLYDRFVAYRREHKCSKCEATKYDNNEREKE